jgi:putative transcriptional regulator
LTLLRDLRETTKLLILLELVKREHSKLKTLAERFGMTAQGMSDYLKMMTAEGLVHSVGGAHKPTMEGVQFLHDRFSELQRFIESSAKDLAIIDVCWAIAASDVKKGQKVGLSMENGYLKAYPGKRSSSTGRALFGSKKGQDIAVTELDGITGLKPGKLVFGKIPGIHQKGSRGADITRLKRLMNEENPDLIAISGASGRALVDSAGLKPDIEFSSLQASIEASEKGLKVLYLCTEEHCTEGVSHITERNAHSEDKLAFDVISLQK